MARILSISYDSALLRTRQLILEAKGHQVSSALEFSAAVELCKAGDFDLVIVGHTVPPADKEQIIQKLRGVCSTPVLALTRTNEEIVKAADYNLDSWDPARFLEYVDKIVKPAKPATGRNNL